MYETALSSLNCLFINYDNLVMGRLSYPCPRVIFLLLLLPFSSPPTDLHGKTLEEALDMHLWTKDGCTVTSANDLGSGLCLSHAGTGEKGNTAFFLTKKDSIV